MPSPRRAGPICCRRSGCITRRRRARAGPGQLALFGAAGRSDGFLTTEPRSTPRIVHAPLDRQGRFALSAASVAGWCLVGHDCRLSRGHPDSRSICSTDIIPLRPALSSKIRPNGALFRAPRPVRPAARRISGPRAHRARRGSIRNAKYTAPCRRPEQTHHASSAFGGTLHENGTADEPSPAFGRNHDCLSPSTLRAQRRPRQERL